MNKEQTAVPAEDETRTQPFLVQYTNEAKTQLAQLEYTICTAVQQKLDVVSSVDPYAHGDIDPVAEHRDRRIVTVEEVKVTFWISPDIRLLTVMRIQQEGESDSWPTPQPRPPLFMEIPRFNPFAHMEDEDDDDAEVGQSVVVAAEAR